MHNRKPEGYRECPPVDEVTEYFIRAFFIMSASRPQGMSGPRGITLSVIKDYRDLYGILGDVNEFVGIISEMDAAYLPVYVRKLKSSQSVAKPPKPGPPRSRSDLGAVSPPTSKQIR